MVKLNSLLSDRFKRSKSKNENHQNALPDVFNVNELSLDEKSQIGNILESFKNDSNDTSADFNRLASITQEVKAINNQAIILHGERIKRAQTILKEYKDGAFSAWLIATYGNRQTPYNFLQYFDFHSSLTPQLKEKMADMPKQAVYTLAARDGEIEKKLKLVEDYAGESKKEILETIRQTFPLEAKDRRQPQPSAVLAKALEKIVTQCKKKKITSSDDEKNQIRKLISEIESLL